MLRLLFIEDEPEAIRPVTALIEKERPDMACEVSGFAEAQQKIVSVRPDVVVLDLLVGGASPDPKPEGLSIREFIWKQHFCPIVVYSAQPDIHDNECDPHPFVKSVRKGKGSPRKFAEALEELRPHIEALKEAESDIRHSFSCAMRDVAPYAFMSFTDVAQRSDTIRRAGRRRLAALMDDFATQGECLASWEQYLSPPISQSIRLGDILMHNAGNSGDPSSFRLVLTPSCDMVTANGRKAKVKNILLARCIPIEEALSRIQLEASKKTLQDKEELSKFKDRLRKTVLSPGYCQTMMPLPALKDKIPAMAADLRALELIPVDSLQPAGGEFLRIASIDSPFRELISWAYLQVACRPGLPDRDFGRWCDEIVEILAQKGATKQK
jgi:CheY-like chemotaxis protein